MKRVKMAVIGAVSGREPCRCIVDPSGRGARLDLRPEWRAGQEARREGRLRWTTKIEEIANSDIAAVGIATRPRARDPCLKMIAAGKHVLVEKPFTTTIADARAIIAAAKAKGTKLMVDFQLRWHPSTWAPSTSWRPARSATGDGYAGSATPSTCRPRC